MFALYKSPMASEPPMARLSEIRNPTIMEVMNGMIERRSGKTQRHNTGAPPASWPLSWRATYLYDSPQPRVAQ